MQRKREKENVSPLKSHDGMLSIARRHFHYQELNGDDILRTCAHAKLRSQASCLAYINAHIRARRDK
jgi:hypothetical protein